MDVDVEKLKNCCLDLKIIEKDLNFTEDKVQNSLEC
jgi:hypothetical protein